MARRRAALAVPDAEVIAGIIARERYWAERRARIEGNRDPAEAADAREVELRARWAEGGTYEADGWQLAGFFVVRAVFQNNEPRRCFRA